MMLTDPHQPIVAIATAPGRGGVGVVRVSGKGLAPLAEALLGHTAQPRRAHFTRFSDEDGQLIDQGLLLYFEAPASYTGQDVVELQGHGGPVVLQLLQARCLQWLQTLADQGQVPAAGRLAEPGEFTLRAFLNDKIDLAQAEAVADLINASSAQAARSAVRSLDGAFSEHVHRLADDVLRLRVLVEATLDFPEEEIDFLQRADAQGQLTQARQQLQTIGQQARQGAALQNGLRVVLAGQPNTGKSSLLNALAQAEVAIVTDLAGTTRDVLQQTLHIQGVPVHVLDTAGLRDTTDVVEREGVSRAWREVGRADAVLWVRDLSLRHQLQAQQADALVQQGLPPSLPCLTVWNKADLVAPAKQPPVDDTTLVVSATTGAGLEGMRHALLHLAGVQSGAEAPFSARARHLRALKQTDEHLQAAQALLDDGASALDVVAEELRLAHAALGQVTGAVDTEQLLGHIFADFCIGK
jgi:tRNA modification GTPase